MVQLNKYLELGIPNPLVFIIDDEEAIVKMLGELLEDEGFRVTTTTKPQLAIKMIGELIPDVVLLDVFMPGLNGLDLLAAIKQEFPSQRIIMISGYGNISMALDAIKAGAEDFVEKPFNIDDVIKKIGKNKQESFFLEDSKKENSSCYASYGIIGKSVLFLELMRQAELIAPLFLPVIIYGKEGIGKRQLAYFIHKKSTLANKEIIEFDCSLSYTEENFIHFLQSKGCLLLLHVDKLSFYLQEKLYFGLKTMQTEDRRFIATASVSLYSLVECGLFLTQLYYELHVLPLEIPALAKRRYDIPLLVEYFLFIENNLQNKNVKISVQAMRALRNYPWLRNVKELKNVIKLATLALPSNVKIITLDWLQKFLPYVENTLIEEQSFGQFNSFAEASAAFEKNFLLYQLKKNRYDLERVSCKTKLKVSQLQNKLASLNILFKK